MIAIIKFAAVFALIYVMAVGAECLSELTYHKKTVGEIENNFRRILLRTFIVVGVGMVAFLIWVRMGWQPTGGP